MDFSCNSITASIRIVGNREFKKMSYTKKLLSIFLPLAFAGCAGIQAAPDHEDDLALTANHAKTTATICNEDRMHMRVAQEQCLQLTSTYVREISNDFYVALYDAVSVPRSLFLHEAMIQAWEKKISDENDIRIINSFSNLCRARIERNIENPAFGLNISVDESYLLPKACVSHIINLSQKYNIPLNASESTRLSGHINWIIDYYKRNPNIPAAEKNRYVPIPGRAIFQYPV